MGRRVNSASEIRGPKSKRSSRIGKVVARNGGDFPPSVLMFMTGAAVLSSQRLEFLAGFETCNCVTSFGARPTDKSRRQGSF